MCSLKDTGMMDTFLASQKGRESTEVNVLERKKQCLSICLLPGNKVTKSLEKVGMCLSCLGEKSQSLHQDKEDPSSAKNLMWVLEKHSFVAWGLASYL